MIALLWKVTLLRLDDDKSTTLESARQKAAALSKTYARQLSHSLEQADQAALGLQYDWEELHQPPLLERRLRRSVRPSLGLRAAGVADNTGRLLASSGPMPEDVAQAGFFLRHKGNRGEGLLVSRVPDGALSSASLLLSRRLDAGDGDFDGLVMFVADPAFLADFGAETGLGRHDFLSLLDSSGQVLLSSAYSRPGVAQSPLMRAYDFADNAGIAVLPANEFDDATRRIVAWQRLAQGGLTVVAGLSENDVLAVHQQAARRHYGWALAATMLLLAAAGAGLRLSLRRARRERRRAELSKTYSLAVDGAEEGFYTVRALYARDGSLSDFVIEDCNERGAELVGWAKRDLVGRRFLQLYSGSHAQQLLSVFGVAMETGYYEDEMLASPHGPLGARWLSRRLVRSGSEIAMTVRDITERRAQEQALSQLANTDPLTGLPNRHWLMEFMPQAITGCIAGNTSMALLFVDLDDFRHINDSLGHGTGDLLLKQAAARLKSLVRASDHVVRLGGDEFTVVLQNVQGSDDVSRVTRLVIKALHEPFEVAGQGAHVVQASVGVSMYPRDGADRDTLLKHADLALYAAKAEGKGRFSFYEPGLSDSLMRRLGKEQALRRAIEQDEFIMFFQPRVNTMSGALCGMEALVRWMHPERGMLAPEEFIQIAEDTGLIREIGSTVIEKTIAQIAAWRELGVPVPPVSINVSALQFDEGHLRPLLVACMKRYRVDAGLIEIEITESSMLGGGDLVSGQLAAIRQLGIKLLIDDFGTGYSSLSQLQRLEMDVLKIDRAFTSQLRNESDANVLFNAIVVMAHALGMRVVAEGVESVGQLRALQAMGCDEVQGFYVSRPVPASDMPALMRQDCLFPPVRAELKLVAGE
ncbi:EAL domain-containing protein|uniref:bifunctional diguanylate cyclase/phosphodiesterase n=1 Tax=Noviherbaspirillum sp. L7-7A TaxID=2850560 RepID=UPI001C2BEDE9|nr:EAL domain-containing protein [Noviherbaspirillum sp. L7-7A]MBV0878604.1 EAL domain-containing protein [Noviherbaspirillum sp. L7-7A]